MSDTEKNQRKLSIYTSLLLIVVLLIGVSYALFQIFARQADQNKISTINCLSVSYEDVSDAINLVNEFPISDKEGYQKTPYTFKVTNTCTQYVGLEIGVETLTTSTISYQYIKASINRADEELPNGAKTLSSGTVGEAMNGGTNYIIKKDGLAANESANFELRLWIDYDTTEVAAGKAWHGKVVVSAVAEAEPPTWDKPGLNTLLAAIKRDNTVKKPLSIPGQEVSGYTLSEVSYTINYNVYSSEKSYYITYGTGWEANRAGTKFNLTGTAVTTNTYANSYSELVGKYLPNYDLSVSGSSTAGAKKTTNNLNSIYYVVSATSSSFTYKRLSSNKKTTEAVLASAEDDYGTSYYFRGAVTNNFVEYANMCWRIVRVLGDGSIKLVLYNYNGLTDSNNTPSSSAPCNVTGDNHAFVRYEGNEIFSLFNEYDTDPDNAYIGLMYGKVGASTYAETHANTTPSTILTNLNKWYTNVLSKRSGFNDNQLADTIWCNDKSTYDGNGYGDGYGDMDTEYLTYKKLGEDSIPWLTCPNDNNEGKLSKFTVNDTKYGNGALNGYAKIGLLTADEVTFAGEMVGIINSTGYLGQNAKGCWWTLSPYYFVERDDSYILSINAYSGSLMEDGAGNSGYIRPALSLKSDIKIASGKGTATNPYKVVME